jgi:hypothetical protein
MSVFLRERDEPKELLGLIAPQRMLVALTVSRIGVPCRIIRKRKSKRRKD